MKDLSQRDKNAIFEGANNRTLYILVRKPEKKVYPAKIYGRLLDYPHIRADHNPDIEAQINWSQAERMSAGYLNYIEI